MVNFDPGTIKLEFETKLFVESINTLKKAFQQYTTAMLAKYGDKEKVTELLWKCNEHYEEVEKIMIKEMLGSMEEQIMDSLHINSL